MSAEPNRRIPPGFKLIRCNQCHKDAVVPQSDMHGRCGVCDSQWVLNAKGLAQEAHTLRCETCGREVNVVQQYKSTVCPLCQVNAEMDLNCKDDLWYEEHEGALKMPDFMLPWEKRKRDRDRSENSNR